MSTPLMVHRSSHFVLWRPASLAPTPSLVIGTFVHGTPPTLQQRREIPLVRSAISADLHQVALADCQLPDGVYHYWFALGDTNVYAPSSETLVTDPWATCVDWRLTAGPGLAPASVIRVQQGRLVPTDTEQAPVDFTIRQDVALKHLPINRQLVIYELPTSWTKRGDHPGDSEVGVGTFDDVRSLITKTSHASSFSTVPTVATGRHLLKLGINALELLPPADSGQDRSKWGYGTANYFAPDFDLGRTLPSSTTTAPHQDASHAISAFLQVVRDCHAHGIRVLYDAVMAFSQGDPYRRGNFLDFHVWWNSGDPEQQARDGFGGDLWKYGYVTNSYDPLTGEPGRVVPARQHMIAHLLHWLDYYHIDGLRLDSVNNFGSWDFAEDVRRHTRAAWMKRAAPEQVSEHEANERFLVIGEELSVPKELLGRLDALWNEEFKRYARLVVLGRSANGESSFEWSVRKLIDCRLMGFSRGDQAINYLCSHDVGGFGNERMFNFLQNHHVVDKAKHLKLAFVCLLTAVGIPMILAGEEFADQHDHVHLTDDSKQIDPVNFDRMSDGWRKDLFDYVARLVKLRTTCRALWSDEIQFIHVDFSEGKRVLAWTRGSMALGGPVIVVANFSDWGTSDPWAVSSCYQVNNWPATPAGHRWREISQDRIIPDGCAGQEPIFPWEAKVYLLEPTGT